ITISMYCFWTGEATVGRIDGVVGARYGFVGGRGEIVTAIYDPRRVTAQAIVRALKRQHAFYAILARDEDERRRWATELPQTPIRLDPAPRRYVTSKHSLRTQHPMLYYVDLTELQALRLNSWAYFGGPMPDLLTPEQKARWAALSRVAKRGLRPSSLRPAREGAALATYRKQLIDWLRRADRG
ncbi:MAG: hypothetical protein KC609_16555, partial [Myxococcales bacterium]|nr:hypothetical protein [Myxococcales bacterium]